MSIKYKKKEDGTTIIVSKTLNYYAEGIVIPNKIKDSLITEIGENAFECNDNLEEVIVLDSEKDRYAFDEAESDFFCCIHICPGVMSLPHTITKIGNYAFSECIKLKWIDVPTNVTEIGDYAFSQCINLKYITFPDSVTKLEYNMFDGCRQLEEITIPENLIEIDKDLFGCCPLKNIKVSRDNKNHSSENGILYNKDKTKLIKYPQQKKTRTKTFICPESVTEISKSAFSYCKYLQRIELPQRITKICEGAFAYCSNLQSIKIPDSITEIGESAFAYCSNLQSIEIPDNITEICYKLFYQSGLKSITLSENITNIYGSAFARCESFESITISENNEKYSSKDGVLYDKNKTLLIEYPNNKSDKIFKIPDSATKINEWAFYGCKNLESVILPDSLKDIGFCAFYNCVNLKEIKIPNSVTKIGKETFAKCEMLKNIEIPENVNEIETNTFWCCSDALIIYGKKGSYAETFANQKNINFEENCCFYL